MKLNSHFQVEGLYNFSAKGDLVTTFYLATDKSRLTKKEIQGTAKNLLQGGMAKIETLPVAKEKKEILHQDLARITDYLNRHLASVKSPGLAIFSASRHNFWEVIELPHDPRNRITFDINFYLRPLSAILERYSKICILLLGRREAKWYQLFMGEIKFLEELKSDVPAKVRKGGFLGYESKRIERHIDAHLQSHFKKVAQKTFDIFKKHAYDWLFINSTDNLMTEFSPHLHSYLKEKLKAQLKVKDSGSQSEVLKAALEAEEKLKKAAEEEIVQRLISELESGGRAVSGLRDTLQRLNQFEIQSLVVTHNFSKPGFVCSTHQFLYVDAAKCPVCQKKTDPVIDVVDEAIEKTIQRKGSVKHITPPSKLGHYGHIGAFLKYKS